MPEIVKMIEFTVYKILMLILIGCGAGLLAGLLGVGGGLIFGPVILFLLKKVFIRGVCKMHNIRRYMHSA